MFQFFLSFLYLQAIPHSNAAKEMMKSFFVGNYYDPDSESDPFSANEGGSNENIFRDAQNISSPFVDLERNTALFLGTCESFFIGYWLILSN
jgi:hypothetical protein